MSEKEIVAANKGKGIIRADDSFVDKRSLPPTFRPTLSEETKKMIHQTHGR